MPKKGEFVMSSAASYIVLKNLNDSNGSDSNVLNATQTEIQTTAESNASVHSVASKKLEIGFNDFLLLTLIVLVANIGFKLLEKILGWLIRPSHNEKKDASKKDVL